MAWEKIFEVGGDGGSIAVMGRLGKDSQWSYLMVCDERTMSSLTEEFSADELYAEDRSDSWEGILSKMDRYPWPRLYPLEPFHEAFKEQIWQAVTARGTDSYTQHHWINCCGRTTET